MSHPIKEFSFDTKEAKEEVLFHIIKSLIEFEEKREEPKTLHQIFHMLLATQFIHNTIENQRPIVNDFTDFVYLLEDEPPMNWFNSWFKKDEYEELEDELLKMTLDNPLTIDGDISDIAYEYYLQYDLEKDTKLKHEQLAMRKVVAYCQRNNLQREYTLIRNVAILSNKSNIAQCKEPLNEEMFHDILNELIFHKPLEEAVKEMHKEIIGPKKLRLCGYCKMPMKEYASGFKCIKYGICDVQKKSLSLKDEVLYLRQGEKRYVVKDGIHFYIRLPGIEENRLYLFLKEKYPQYLVILYPDCEQKGDISIQGPTSEFLIDLKDYKNEEMLFFKLKEKMHSVKNKNFIYIPEYRVQSNKDYLSFLRDKLPYLTLGSQKKLIMEINSWFKKEGK